MSSDTYSMMLGRDPAGRDVARVREYPVIPVSRAAARQRRLKFVASDETVDKFRDVILVDGWRPVTGSVPFLLGHGRGDIPLGRVDRVYKSERGGRRVLIAEAQFPPVGKLQKSDDVFSAFETGVMDSVSVGFQPIASRAPTKAERERGVTGTVFTDQELLEVSAVSVPANPSASLLEIRARLDADELDLDDSDLLEELYGDEREPVDDAIIRAVAGLAATSAKAAADSLLWRVRADRDRLRDLQRRVDTLARDLGVLSWEPAPDGDGETLRLLPANEVEGGFMRFQLPGQAPIVTLICGLWVHSGGEQHMVDGEWLHVRLPRVFAAGFAASAGWTPESSRQWLDEPLRTGRNLKRIKEWEAPVAVSGIENGNGAATMVDGAVCDEMGKGGPSALIARALKLLQRNQ